MYRYDAEIGLHHTKYRSYDPMAGRWLQFDPIGYKDSMSLYEYVASNPVNFNDPYGLYAYEWPPKTMPIEPIEEGICKKIKKRWENKISKGRNKLARYANFLAATPSYMNMPFQHCMWNCRLTIDKGRDYAEKMSRLKEEVDELHAKYGIALKEAGCWDTLSRQEKEQIGHAARSAWQPGDHRDNEIGRICGERVDKDKCDDQYNTEYCMDCCQANGVASTSPEGPGTCREFGKYKESFPDFDVRTVFDYGVNRRFLYKDIVPGPVSEPFEDVDWNEIPMPDYWGK